MERPAFSQDIRFGRFMEKLAAQESPALFSAAVLLSRAVQEGHVCLDLAQAGAFLSEPPQDASVSCFSPQAWASLLLQTPVVGRPGGFFPLILDDASRLYLHRFHTHEATLSRAILSRCQSLSQDVDMGLLQNGLGRWFSSAYPGYDWQKAAAATAVLRRFCVISGGPGTGKTTTVARILALLLAQNPLEKIVLCAPTGKASARLALAVAHEKGRLADGMAGLDAFPAEAFTIHRLLGVRPGPDRFLHNEDNPLAVDTLVVDEASMVDLALMSRLVAALPENSRLILLGDRDQLASVAPGAVMGDICGPRDAGSLSEEFYALLTRAAGQDSPRGAESGVSPIADSVAVLKKNYRFSADAGIGKLARLIVTGEAVQAADLLEAGQDPDICFVRLDDPGRITTLLEDVVPAGLGPYCAAREPVDALAALERFRILCAVREGPFGVERINAAVENLLEKRRMIRLAGYPWYEKRPVLIARNDYAINLFNGDIAYIQGKKAIVAGQSADLREISPLLLPEHETAFAMTVHKSQGSEFEEVLLVLPGAGSPVLSRELLYTAVTRARKRLRVAGTREAVIAAVSSPTRRASGLADALWARS